jgi:hypothetical protein
MNEAACHGIFMSRSTAVMTSEALMTVPSE